MPNSQVLAGVKTNTEPFYFGPAEKPLFGCYQLARQATGGVGGIVFCYPMGHEYIRCHRAFRQLTNRLTDTGFPVLRFDYSGCGDSSGDVEQLCLGQWRDDIALAVRQMRGRTRAVNVRLAGLRLGASLSMLHGAERGDIDSMVLWDPVIDGESYLQDFADQHEKLEAEVRMKFGQGEMQSEPDVADNGSIEFLGFRYSESMVSDLKRIDLLKVERKPARRVLLINNAENPDATDLSRHLADLGVEVEYKQVSDPRIWLAEPYKAVVPHQSIEALIDWISRDQP